MSVLSGIVDIAKNVGNAALAPVKGLGKMVATGLETNLKVAGDVLTLQPGKAIDDLGQGLHKQVGNVVGIPKDQWSALKGEAGGLGEVALSGAKFLGEPIRGAGRIVANDLSTLGNASGNALQGNFGQAGNDLVGGVGKNFSILGETAVNQTHNLF